MAILKTVEFTTDGNTLVSCDFDVENKLAALIKLAGGGHSARFNEVDHVIPIEWSPHLLRIKWLDSDDVLLWPVCLPLENSSYVGRVGKGGLSILSLGYPLDVFTDRGIIACAYPEEQIVITEDLQRQSDLIAVFSRENMTKIARFIEPFMADFKNIPFMEIEKGVLDGECYRFWFSAFSTELLWCYEFKKAKVFSCQLGCRPTDVLAICSDGSRCLVIIARKQLISVRVFRRSEFGIDFDQELPLGPSIVSGIREIVDSNGLSGELIGYCGGRVGCRNGGIASLYSVR